MKTPTDSLALFANVRNTTEYGTLTLTVIKRPNDAEGPWTQSWTEADETHPSNDWNASRYDYPTFNGFNIHAQWNVTPNAYREPHQPYAMRFGFDSASLTIDFDSPQDSQDRIDWQLKTLSQITRKYTALVEKFGTPASLEEFIVLVARAMNIDSIAEISTGDDSRWLTRRTTLYFYHGPNEMKRYIRNAYKDPSKDR